MKRSPFCPELVYVEGGTFFMGNLAKPVEQPVIQVTVPSFWIGKYLVTFDEYDYFCEQTGREKPALYRSERQGYPVTTVSWLDAVAHTQWLSEVLNRPVRLPSEAEWEFAARGGNLSQGFIYAGSNNLDEVGWYDDNTHWKFRKVGELKPNELGLYDMSGLKSELCFDDWKNDLSLTPLDGSPLQLGKTTKKVLKNDGGMHTRPFSCEPSRRYGVSQKVAGSNYSFRIAMSV